MEWVDALILGLLTLLNLVAMFDVWTSRLSRGACILWFVLLLFLPVVSLVAWLLTRASAHQELEPA